MNAQVHATVYMSKSVKKCASKMSVQKGVCVCVCVHLCEIVLQKNLYEKDAYSDCYLAN